ncbi:alpha/beta fold hydrolase [Xanthomonas sp. MUS 060]|uniref:alpha/beta fold hydrolase n=1 Tax=Xanthomonas sp. MUS 060 TaxID=1588031 RepID=UPI000A488B8F|nr:alpha/beta fold hydrolase [Xanthomonas sp. MUS 060]
MKESTRLKCELEPDSVMAMDRYFERWYLFHRSKRPPEEDQFWSALPDRGFILNSIRVGLRSMGEGPNILLVHGISGRGSQFASIARALAESGWRTLMIDFSDEGNDESYKISINDVVAAFAEIIRREGALHGVVAHSLGNLWIWYAIARGLRINHFVAISGVFRASMVFEYFQRMNRLSDKEMNTLKVMLNAHEGGDVLTMQDPSFIITQMPRPKRGLIIHGRDDRVVGFAEGQAYAAAWREADYMEIPGTSHANILKVPNVVTAVKNFFASSSEQKTENSHDKSI